MYSETPVQNSVEGGSPTFSPPSSQTFSPLPAGEQTSQFNFLKDEHFFVSNPV